MIQPPLNFQGLSELGPEVEGNKFVYGHRRIGVGTFRVAASCNFLLGDAKFTALIFLRFIRPLCYVLRSTFIAAAVLVQPSFALIVLSHDAECQVEWNTACQRVLASRISDGLLPPGEIHSDIRSFRPSAEIREQVECLTGGFPCQAS